MIRYFNTSGPNNAQQHFTIERKALVHKGFQMVLRQQYFTICGPRQTGKSTYFRQLAGFLEAEGYKVAHTNLESLRNAPLSTFLEIFASDLDRQWGTTLPQTDIAGLFHAIEQLKEEKLVLIINIRGQEFVIETKVYYSPGKFESGKRQLAYYCQSLGLTTGLYLVFCPNNISYPDIVREGHEDFEGTKIQAYIIPYDEERWD